MVRLIAIGGMSGTGKSTLAQALAARTGARLVRSDVIRKRAAGVAPRTEMPASAYTAAARAAVYRAMMDEIRKLLAAGCSVIADAVWDAAEDRAALEAMAGPAGVGFSGFWLSAPLDQRLRRVAVRSGDASDATEDSVRAQAARRTPPPSGWRAIPAAGEPEGVLETVLAALDQTVR